MSTKKRPVAGSRRKWFSAARRSNAADRAPFRVGRVRIEAPVLGERRGDLRLLHRPPVVEARCPRRCDQAPDPGVDGTATAQSHDGRRGSQVSDPGPRREVRGHLRPRGGSGRSAPGACDPRLAATSSRAGPWPRTSSADGGPNPIPGPAGRSVPRCNLAAVTLLQGRLSCRFGTAVGWVMVRDSSTQG